MHHWRFNTPKMCLITLRSEEWRRLNNSHSFLGLVWLEIHVVLVVDVPMCPLMPFSQVIAHPTVWNKKHITRRESHVTEKVLVERYLYVIHDSILPQHSVCNRTVPPTQHIDEKKVEVTSKKAILREVTLSVVHECMIFGRREDVDMCSIYSTNTLVEELEVGTF